MTKERHPDPGPVLVFDIRRMDWKPATYGRYPHRVFTPKSRYARVGSYTR